MNYGKIISDSFRIFWKHKSLWAFGIIAALVGQGDYSFSVNYRESTIGTQSAIPNLFASFLVVFLSNPVPYLICVAVIGLSTWLLFDFVGWFAKGALIGMVNEIDMKGTTSVGNGWHIGEARAVSLFSVSLVLALPRFIVLASAFVLALPVWLPLLQLVAGSSTGETPNPEQMQEAFRTTFPDLLGVFLLICGLICLTGILGWGMSLWNTLAARSCVTENLGVLASLRKGGQIAVRNIGYVLLNWLILAILSTVYGFIAALPALALWIPTAQALLHNTWSFPTIIAAVLFGVYFLATSVCLGGVLTTFNSTLWTKLYKSLVSKEIALQASVT
jgi:hypothetical protein